MKYRPIATTFWCLTAYFIYSGVSYFEGYNPDEIKNNYIEVCQQSLNKIADMSNHKIIKEDEEIINQRCEYVYGNTDYFIPNLKWLYKKYNNKVNDNIDVIFNDEYEKLKEIRGEENLHNLISKFI